MTTSSATHAVASSAAPRSPRPVWQRLGGGGILVAAALLLVATILEYVYWGADGDRSATLIAFIPIFSLSLLVYFAAMFPLAFGRSGSDGIVADSVVGKASLIAFGTLFLANETLYLIANYFTDPASDFVAANVASLILAALQYLAALVAAVVIIRAGIARGAARWSLLIAVVIGLICGSIVQSTDSLELTTFFYGISTLVQILVGISYLTAPRKEAASS